MFEHQEGSRLSVPEDPSVCTEPVNLIVCYPHSSHALVCAVEALGEGVTCYPHSLFHALLSLQSTNASAVSQLPPPRTKGLSFSHAKRH